MNATPETCFTVTLNGCIEAGRLRSRRSKKEHIEPTQKGRAYVAVAQAEVMAARTCVEVSDGAPVENLDEPSHRLAVALADWREATGTDFYHQEEAGK